MKKLLIIAAAVLTISAAAQTKEETAIAKRLEKSDAAIADAKKSGQANTWIDRASIYIDMTNVYTSQMVGGFPAEAILKQMGDPINIEDVEVVSLPMKKYVFQDLDVYVNAQGLIQYWTAKKEIDKDALTKALECLTKAKELSAKDFVNKGKGYNVVMLLDNQYQTEAMSNYSLGKPAIAARKFDESFQAKELIGKIDTVSVYYAGVAFAEGGEHQNALERFEKALSLNYIQDGSIYFYIGTCQEALGKTQDAIATYETGFGKFPQNQSIMASLINAYMSTGQNTDKLITIIKKAQELDPKNASLFLVESNVWDKLGDKVKAEEAIQKAEAINPDDFTVVYNYAIMKVLQAEKLIEAAGKLDLNDSKTYDEMIAQALAAQTTAIEKLEKAHKLDATNDSTIDILRQLYYPRREKSPEMTERYNYFLKLYNAQHESQE